MPSTYTKLFVHIVFAVRDRNTLIKAEWQHDLYRYMTGIVANQGHRTLIINGVADHVHLLVNMSPRQSCADLVAHIKRSSSLWINKNQLSEIQFIWQEGYSAFSYAPSQLGALIRYIKNQQTHHQTHSFEEEHQKMLKACEAQSEPSSEDFVR